MGEYKVHLRPIELKEIYICIASFEGVQNKSESHQMVILGALAYSRLAGIS